MMKLLIIADDFTGALDTGVQFAAKGAATCVVTDPSYDFGQVGQEVQVLVMDAETRHLPGQDAYRVVYRAVRSALDAGFSYIYKKTDSGLRGNIGAELTAVMDASGADHLPFLPAFPKMDRITRDGIHYISGIPVADSVFGQDPFEPVQVSTVAEIIGQQSQAPVVLCSREREADAPGIRVYDAATDEDLRAIGFRLGQKGLRISAGCAGVASVLAELLALSGKPPRLPKLVPSLFVTCGSVNPVTQRQLKVAQAAGFPRFRLRAEQKLDLAWTDCPGCVDAIRAWLEQAGSAGLCILDANDEDGSSETQDYALARGLSAEEIRQRISTTLGRLMKRLLDSGLNATLMCTGGDTLMAMMRQVSVSELVPVCELAPGVVLTDFTYHGTLYHIISKSGGFGEPDLLCSLANLLGVEKKEDTVC